VKDGARKESPSPRTSPKPPPYEHGNKCGECGALIPMSELFCARCKFD
jgi:hypothetical protein